MKLDADKVRWHRDSRGWTLETTAEKAEVALGTVLRAEHGEDIRPSSGRRIARAFGVDISELVPDRPGVTAPKAKALSSSGQPSSETPPKASKPRLEEHFDRVSAAEVEYLNWILADLWRLGLPGEKPKAHFVPEDIDTNRVWDFLNFVLTTPGIFEPELTPAAVERFNRGARKLAVVGR